MAVIVVPLTQEPHSRKLVVRQVSGPASYATGGFTVSFPELRAVHYAVATATGGYLAEVASISGNSVTIKVLYFDYDAAADGPAIEVPAGTDLSTVTITIIAVGE